MAPRTRPSRQRRLYRASALLASLLTLALGGCGSLPRPGEVVSVAANRPLTLRDLGGMHSAAAARPALQAAGMGPAEIAAGRVLRVQCAVTTDGWWDSLAVLPADFGPIDQRALLLRVVDAGDNDRLPVNFVTGRVEPALGQGGQAYTFIPDWRERGLSRNFERVAPAGGPASDYLVVQGSWVVRCRR